MSKLTKPKIVMIRIKDHAVSEAYAAYCAPAWQKLANDRGWTFEFYDAVTPHTLNKQKGLSFNYKAKKVTETEKACFYSQYNLWKECSTSLTPYLILEHDALLVNPDCIVFNEGLFIQYFGQHSMEAVMYTPAGARRVVSYVNNTKVTGPMMAVDSAIGMFKKGPQSKHRLPHSRFIGPHAPVKSVVDINLGTTIEKRAKQVVDRIKEGQADLFEIVDLTG